MKPIRHNNNYYYYSRPRHTFNVPKRRRRTVVAALRFISKRIRLVCFIGNVGDDIIQRREGIRISIILHRRTLHTHSIFSLAVMRTARNMFSIEYFFFLNEFLRVVCNQSNPKVNRNLIGFRRIVGFILLYYFVPP